MTYISPSPHFNSSVLKSSIITSYTTLYSSSSHWWRRGKVSMSLLQFLSKFAILPDAISERLSLFGDSRSCMYILSTATKLEVALENRKMEVTRRAEYQSLGSTPCPRSSLHRCRESVRNLINALSERIALFDKILNHDPPTQAQETKAASPRKRKDWKWWVSPSSRPPAPHPYSYPRSSLLNSSSNSQIIARCERATFSARKFFYHVHLVQD